jgi:hypothetical protein
VSSKQCLDVIFSDAASAGVLSPAASGFIKCGSMLSASPLPASSIKSNSFSGSMDDILWSSSDKIDVLVTPDRKGKGRAYEPDQPLPSVAQSGPSRKRGRADSIDELKSSSISPIPDRKGKGRAYEPGQPRLLASGINVDRMVQPQSSMESKSSTGRLAAPVYRSRKHIPEMEDEDDQQQQQSRSLKRLRRHESYHEEVDLEVISITSSDDDDDFIIDETTEPSSSPPQEVQEMREKIREAIRYLRKDPAATEMSRAQMDAMIAVMLESRDVMVAMKTGGGKSMLWMVPPVIDEDTKCMVVCPFVALLEEQYTKTVAAGLRCHNYCYSKDVPDNVQVLFIQVEHCSTIIFHEYEQLYHLSTAAHLSLTDF